MAQGVERKKEEVLEALKPYFKLGCSVLKACKYAGVPPSTVDTWIQNDDDLRVQVTAWQNEISAKARANWRAKIASGEYLPSLQWLERNEKDEFSLRNEHTGADGEKLNETIPLTPELINIIRKAEDEMKKHL